jgi:hypothetical protein
MNNPAIVDFLSASDAVRYGTTNKVRWDALNAIIANQVDNRRNGIVAMIRYEKEKLEIQKEIYRQQRMSMITSRNARFGGF